MEPRPRWWLEWEIWLLALCVSAMYLTRLGAAAPTGEEPRRGQVAREMIESGDWIVPREQGLPFLSRPPVQNWAIAVVALLRGQVDPVAIRMPSALAILLTVLLIYGFSRTFLSRPGALAAAASFPTMGLVLQFGWLGETEAIYTFLVASSLLLWRWADLRKLPPIVGWSVGYGFAALGMLTKGPQAPVYFLGGVALYLLYTRRARELLRLSHLAGIAVFLLICAAWEIPFCMRVGAKDAWTMLTLDTAARFNDAGPLRFFEHLVVFPVQVAACTMPWSILLLAYCHRSFRNVIRYAAEDIRFLAIVSIWAFLTCWFVPGARNRYFAPLFPCIAPMIGLVIDRCGVEVASAGTILWKRYLRGMGIFMSAVGVWLFIATIWRFGPDRGEQPRAFAIGFLPVAFAFAAAAFWSSMRSSPARLKIGVLGVTAFMGLSYLGSIINIFVETRSPINQMIADLNQRLPEGTKLVSLGEIDSVFLYNYGKPIRRLPPKSALANADWTYFCVGDGPRMPECTFPYEKIAVVSVEGRRSADPHDVVMIGRRLTEVEARHNATIQPTEMASRSGAVLQR